MLIGKVLINWDQYLPYKHSVPALIRRCDDLHATTTHVPVASVLVLNTPDDGRLRPKHVEWPCRNKTCTLLHQVGVSIDLYYDARKHKIKTYRLPVKFIADKKARLHGSPRLINTVESTKVNRVNSSFQRKWSTRLTGEQVGDGQLSFNVVDSLWVTHHRLPVSTSTPWPVPRCRTSRTSFFSSYFFFLKCVDILSLNSHISQQHLPAQVHLPPFWNQLPRSSLWNFVNSIVQLLNWISLIQPRWSTWGPV
jgi:hypothetical protein